MFWSGLAWLVHSAIGRTGTKAVQATRLEPVTVDTQPRPGDLKPSDYDDFTHDEIAALNALLDSPAPMIDKLDEATLEFAVFIDRLPVTSLEHMARHLAPHIRSKLYSALERTKP